MMLEISELLLPAVVIQILQFIKELVCHTFDNKKLYPKTSAINMRPIAASNSSVAQTRQYGTCFARTMCNTLGGVGWARASNNKHPLIKGFLPKMVFFVVVACMLVFLSLGMVSLVCQATQVAAYPTIVARMTHGARVTVAVFLLLLLLLASCCCLRALLHKLVRHSSYE
jgi:hypothetical protein